MSKAFWENFLGHSPDWYKWLVLVFLAVNPVLLALAGPLVASWAILLEFIGTLMMALRCYPLQPGGLLAIQAVVLGLVTPTGIQHEIETGLPVILLLMFMVAAIYFLREMLVYTFTKLLIRVQSRSLLAFLFVATGCTSLRIPGRVDGACGDDHRCRRILCRVSPRGIWEAASRRRARRECGRRDW